MSDKSKTVAFSLTSFQPRAWLVLKGDTQQPRVVEMQQGHPGIWSASEDLIPDEYLCRFYCGDDLHVFYHGPAATAGGTVIGMDMLLSVGATNNSGTHIQSAEHARP
jgi:hypothetical protein